MLLETRAFDDGKPPARDTSGRGRKALLIAGSLLAVGLVGLIEAWLTLSLNSTTIGTVVGQPPPLG